MKTSLRPIHRRDIILNVLIRWKDQYRNYPDDKIVGIRNPRPCGEVRAALEQLDLSSCSESDVNAAIGTNGWSANLCDECEHNFAVLLRIGDDTEDDSRYVDMCLSCLLKAANLLALTEAKK